jgi:branched-chain amino acid transport system substrate-binding protein
VIRPLAFKRKALSILCTGMAFLVFSCQPKPPVPKLLEPEPDLALLSFAEAEYLQGRRDRALEAYREYVERNPGSPRVRDALHRIATINEETGEYESALTLYQKLLDEFPDDPRFAEVSLDKARILYRLGRYDESRHEALLWLGRFPAHALVGTAFVLLGKTSGALGEEARAFEWYVRATQAFSLEDPIQQELDEYVAGLLEKAGMESLKFMAQIAPEGTRYLPAIYHRIAGLALDANDLDLAEGAAAALVRSTPDQYWVDRGRDILDRVAEERAVRKGAIGCLLPLSGPFAIYGQEVLNGMQLAMGVFGSSEQRSNIELLIEDTRSDPGIAVEKVEELAHKSRVMGIIGPLASRTATAAAKKAQELGVPIITLAQREGITEEGEMVFRNFLTPAKEMDRLVSRAIHDLGLLRFGILYPESAYGRRLLNLFWDRVEEEGAYITAVESYGSEVTDFSEEIKKMVGLYYPRPPSVAEKLTQANLAAFDAGVESGPYEETREPEPVVEFDAVFIPDNFQKIALIAPQFPFHGIFNIRFLGTSLWQSPDLLEQGAEYLQGAIFPTGFFAGAEEAFVRTYKENFETDPGILAAIGYDIVRFLNHLMETQAPRTRRALQQALLLKNDFYGLRGILAFDTQREATTPAVLLTIQGKRFVLFLERRRPEKKPSPPRPPGTPGNPYPDFL